MEQTNTTTEGTMMPAKRPQFLTTLCILSYIGSGLWALLALIGMIASGWIMGMLGIAVENAATSPDMNNMDPEAVHAASGLLGMGTTIIIIACLVFLLLNALSIFGAVKMWQQKKSGFIMYTIANGIMLVMFVLGHGWFMSVVTAAFIAMYAANLKHLK